MIFFCAASILRTKGRCPTWTSEPVDESSLASIGRTPSKKALLAIRRYPNVAHSVA
jgi:hypothetical protein